MIRNKDGVPIDPTDINRADGFSPGSALLTKVPGLDTPTPPRRASCPPLTDLSRGVAHGSPVVVINARTGERHPIWAEIDSNPPDPANRVLIIRPAVNFEEGERYIVALRPQERRGRRAPGERELQPYRDRTSPPIPRSSAAGRTSSHLRHAEVGRRGPAHLYLAWDFTVASSRSLAGRMLHLRDTAFAGLGDRNLRDLGVQGISPPFTIDSVVDLTPAQDDRIARQVEGTFMVPCFLTKGCAPGGQFSFDARAADRRGRPRPSSPAASRGRARPRLADEGAAVALRARPARRPRRGQRGQRARRWRTSTTSCSARPIGPASPTRTSATSSRRSGTCRSSHRGRPHAAGLPEPAAARRAMIHPQGFASNPAFQKNGTSVIDTRRLYFDGNSQGGDHGRRADRGGAGLRARRPGRARA